MASRYYSISRGHSAALEHVKAYYALEGRLGPVVRKMLDAFFGLGKEELHNLFIHYEAIYGRQAGSYARDSYPKWRNGEKKISGMIAERLIKLVPRYINTRQRFDLVKELCIYHQEKLYRTIEVDKKNQGYSIEKVEECLKDFLSAAARERFPNHVFETVVWLNDSDSLVARKMLNDAQRINASLVEKEVRRQWPVIIEIIKRKDIKNFSETFVFPNGELTILKKEESLCFIATAAYGNPNHPDVILLRKFRDNVLNKNLMGRVFIASYQLLSPWMSRRIDKKVLVRQAVKSVLQCTIVSYVRKRYGRRWEP